MRLTERFLRVVDRYLQVLAILILVNSSSSAETTITINEPMSPPSWALAQRALLKAGAEGAEVFAAKYLDDRGFFRCVERWGGNDGPDDVMEVVYALALELGTLSKVELDHTQLDAAISTGRARETFERWAVLQGGDREWLAAPDLSLADHEYVLEAAAKGVLSRVDTRTAGRLLGEVAVSGKGRARRIDPAVALHYGVRIGDRVEAGEEIGRLYLGRADDRLADAFRRCFVVEEEGAAPPLIVERLAG